MSLKKLGSKLISRVAIVGVGLLFLANPLLAHDQHHHNSTQQEQVKDSQKASEQHTNLHEESEHPTGTHEQIEDKSELSPSSQPENLSESQSSTSIRSSLESNQMSLLPQPGELIFGLLIVCPLGLFAIKRWIYER